MREVRTLGIKFFNSLKTLQNNIKTLYSGLDSFSNTELDKGVSKLKVRDKLELLQEFQLLQITALKQFSNTVEDLRDGIKDTEEETNRKRNPS